MKQQREALKALTIISANRNVDKLVQKTKEAKNKV